MDEETETHFEFTVTPGWAGILARALEVAKDGETEDGKSLFSEKERNVLASMIAVVRYGLMRAAADG